MTKLFQNGCVCLFCMVSLVQVRAQTYSVTGNVSSPLLPVRYASVTFVDVNDTTRKFSALTDTIGNYRMDIVSGVASSDKLPEGFALYQNYPNPFLTTTAIGYQLDKQSDVVVTVYDILGREVKRFALGAQQAGVHDVRWDGRTDLGRKVAAGIYLYRLQTKHGSQVKKMLFGIGERSAPLATIGSSVMGTAVTTPAKAFVVGGTYTVKIENRDSTFPPISSTQFSNVTVQSDTTLNYTVSTNNFFPAVVYLDSVQQYIRGFGGANILPWRPDMTVADVDKCFGSGPGQIGMTILRLRVPNSASEFAPQVATAQRAIANGAIVMASPWSPPAWMKSNNNIVGGHLNDTSYASYALHLKSFVDFMWSNGAPLYAISVQNEPDITVTYESCDWDSAQMRKFVRNNASTIGTRVIVPESFQFRRPISDAILNDAVAAANVAIIGGHIYGGGLAPYPLAVSKGKEIWMTEHLILDTMWTDALGTGKEINDVMNAGMSAYLWWYIKRFYGPFSESGNITKRGYVMSQYARFIRPGFSRVASTVVTRSSIDVTAYKRDAKIVIVALNRTLNVVTQSFVLKNGAAASFARYVTSATKSCVQEGDVAVRTNSFTVTLDAQSVTTFVSN
ncbi:MAG: T9SS type A sorting domain-containing protein [Ignavibacteriae bacterium]|nr:T9SS type A sorting domain-containing protein [Ignavibacteriota bacterium]